MTATTERLKLRNTMQVPVPGWQCRMPEDDVLIQAQTYSGLLAAVKAYRTSRNYPIGAAFEADAQNWMCQDLPTSVCRPVDAENASLGQKAIRFARELARWAAEGCPVVDDSVLAQRRAACETCPYYHASGNAGMGQCTAPGCSCTRLKLWLGTTKCPHPKGSRWPV